jgi:hypothetical protein
MTVTEKAPRNEGFPTPSPIPSLISTSVTMSPEGKIGPYTLYSASSTVSSVVGVKYGVISGQYSDSFKDIEDLGDTCDIITTTPLTGGSRSSSISYFYSVDTSASSKYGSSSSTISATMAQPKSTQFKRQHIGLNNRFEPTKSTEYIRVRPLAPTSITTHYTTF